MAYTVWSIFMKKYTKVRRGLTTRALPLNSKDECIGNEHDAYSNSDSHTESWYTADSEETSWNGEKKCKNQPSETAKKLSKTKRVKNYLKRCKVTANNIIQHTQLQSSNKLDEATVPEIPIPEINQPKISHTAWYVTNEFYEGEQVTNYVTVRDIADAAKNIVEESNCRNVASINSAKIESDTAVAFSQPNPDYSRSPDDIISAISLLFRTPRSLEEFISDLPNAVSEEKYPEKVKVDVATLVDQYFGPYYRNYKRTRRILVRQARDVLVCNYLGNVATFEHEFCIPISQLLKDIYERAKVHVGSVVCSRGWPLSAGRNGIILHFTELEQSLLRNGDCYLCVRLFDKKPELVLNWKSYDRGFFNIVRRGFDSPLEIMANNSLIENGNYVPNNCNNSSQQDTALELSSLLKKLIVSVDRAIERVPLESLSFPCPQCLGTTDEELVPKCQCSLTLRLVDKKDSCIQTSPMFEMDQTFPHIDSDEDYEYVGRSENGGSNTVSTQCSRIHTVMEHNASTDVSTKLKRPTSIRDLPEKLLMSGITFPGISDKLGRSVIVYDVAVVTRSELQEYDIATLILYYCHISTSIEQIENGICILVVSPEKSEDIDLLDKALNLLHVHIKIDCILVVWKKTDYHRIRHFKSNQTRATILHNSKTQFRLLTESDSLEEYLDWSQVPSDCGGQNTHDQLEWIQFYKDVEPFLLKCHTCGRRLVGVMSELKTFDGITLTRRQLHYQQRIINRVLNEAEMVRLRMDGQTTLAQIEERAGWLPNSQDVNICVERCERLFAEVQRAAKRLEQLAEKRREKLRELIRIRALEDETTQVISWLTQNGEDKLKQHSDLANNLPDIKQQEQDFEKFYFISMRNLDKAGDLLEEAGQCSGGTSLKDLARSLKQHLRGFSDRLEDTRERLEDTSRCFYLLDRAYEWALDAMKYMSRIKPEDIQNPGQSVKQLRQYLMAHPPPSNEHFTEMLQLAQKLLNDKLLEQCRVAQCRCEETVENIRSLIGSEVPNWVVTSTPLVGRRRSLPSSNRNHDHQSSTDSGNQSTSCLCWDSPPLDNIPEECFCHHSGRNVNPLQRSCTWQYPTENYDDEDKLSSSADNTTEGSETGTKSSSEDVEEVSENSCSGNSAVPPVPVNSHLHRNDSLHLNTNCGPQTLKKQKTAKLIMREMVQTERDYVKALEYVIENYIPELIREDIPQALRGQRNVIFGNIEKIYEFHNQSFLRELERCEHNPFCVGQSFLNHEKKFYLYALYNKNKPKSDALLSEYGTSFFKAKQLSLGDKMDLASYLLKPVQRMGKYALLLQQLMKVSRTDFSELREAEEMVRFQLRHGNDLLAMDSLRECDVNLKEQGRLLRQNEFLVWQGKGKKCLRHVFLFEELILFSKARRFPDRKNLDLYIYKNSIKTSDIGLTARVSDSTTKFEIWYRKRKPCDTFTLQSVSEDIKRAWIQELSNLLWKQALKNREMRMVEMSSMGIGNKPCLDIRPSADQINDRSISIDQLCKTAPRFRNSIAVSTMDSIRKRPHSVISVSSNSSSGGSSSSNGDHQQTTSHCSSIESGIVPDWNANTLSTNSSIVSDSNSALHPYSVKL